MRVLYISQTGMLEGLGRSQVLAYQRGLARRGAEIDLLSYELPEATDREIELLEGELREAGIRWLPLRRARDSRLRVKVAESLRGVVAALRAGAIRRPDIVHGRSYLPTAIADVVSRLLPRARLVFDCRGMLGDEYVDAGYWTKERLEYRLVKRYETRAFKRADGVVVLTDALRRWIDAQGWLGPHTAVEAIPCCVDLDQFRFLPDARARIRGELGIDGDTSLLVYAGSLGSFYEEGELARFAGVFRRRAEGGAPARFLLLTRSEPKDLVARLMKEGFPAAGITVVRARPDEMPGYLSAGDLGLSFIQSCFSKMGSSPTKVAEYLAAGLPVVLNGDIGDQRDLATERDACVVLPSYREDAVVAAADHARSLVARPLAERVAATRRVAAARLDLEAVGVARYARLYDRIMTRTTGR
jgi:glycosyltransferase involved in cell wall biosynthesis